MRFRYTTEWAVRSASGFPSSLRSCRTSREARAADLQSAGRYLQQFHSTPVDVPGTTAIGISSAVLAALKTKGEADLVMFDLPGRLPADPKLSADPNKHPSVFDHRVPLKLRRAESGPVPVPLTVNGVKTDLPAIHATATGEYGEKGEFFFLDDERNP